LYYRPSLEKKIPLRRVFFLQFFCFCIMISNV
jgi:hypothetical protein